MVPCQKILAMGTSIPDTESLDNNAATLLEHPIPESHGWRVLAGRVEVGVADLEICYK
jgi:hypothetical protein